MYCQTFLYDSLFIDLLWRGLCWLLVKFFLKKKKKSLIKLNNYHISSVRESSIRQVQIATSSGDNASSHW